MKRYRVERVHWAAGESGPRDLEDQLNAWATEGWELAFVVPTLADTSIHALKGASAGTTEMAVVLQQEA